MTIAPASTETSTDSVDDAVDDRALVRLLSVALDELAPIAARHQAFDAVVDRWQRFALKRAFHYLGDSTGAEDAAQEAFVLAWRSLPNLREPAAFPGWFAQIVRTCCNRAVRGRRLSTVSLSLVDDLVGAGEIGDPVDTLLRAERDGQLQDAIARLPAHELVCARRYYFDCLSQAQIAAELDVPATTVKKRLFSARRRLRERLRIPMPELDTTQNNAAPDDFGRRVRLKIAVEDNDAESIDALLTAEPALADSSLVRRASSLGHASAAEALLAFGAPLDGALHALAAGAGRIDIAERLLDAGADLDGLDARGRTPLQLAARAAVPIGDDDGDHFALCEFLLARGARLDPHSAAALDRAIGDAPPDADGVTPLQLAARGGWKKATRLLLDAGADPDARDSDGLTSRDLAIAFGHDAVDEMLAAAGASVTGKTPPAANLEPPAVWEAAAANGDLDTLAALFADDPELARRRNVFHQTPLQVAATAGNTNAVSWLLQHEARVDAIDRAGRTGLIAAARAGFSAIAHQLLDAGADASFCDHAGRSALFFAPDVRLASRLIDTGAPITVCGPGRETPLHAAATHGRAEVASLLLARGADPNARNFFGATPLLLSARGGFVDVFHVLLAGGAELGARDQWHRTALHVGAWFGHPAIVAAALDAGLYIHEQSFGFSTALHVAADAGHVDVARLLLDRGIDVRARTDFGRTPLHDAVKSGCAPMVELLLSRGALPDDPNTRGVTPLHWAAAGGKSEIAELLLAHGASPTITSAKGETAADLARRHGHEALADRLGKGVGC